ncbi:MAG: phage/plasmid primase, P4 family [Desulfobulbaceae bacterium]|nr:phage/plasmid primase, P4 family [Desulfobulbaceae bacterium]
MIEDLDKYRKEAEQMAAEEKAKRKPKDNGGNGGGDEPDIKFVKKCYHSNAIGDSLLFNDRNRGKFAYNVISGRWLTYTGPHWELDYTGRALAAIETTVVPQYLRLLKDIDDEIADDPENTDLVKRLKNRKKGLLARIDRLRDVPGRKNCLTCAATNAAPLVVHENELDQHPWLLATPNAVIDLRTGEDRPGAPGDYLTKTTRTEWRGLDAQCPKYDAFIREVLGDNDELLAFFDRLIGYAITGLNIERIFVVLFGAHGQNGKGTIMEILYHILGVLAGPIQAEILISNRGTKTGSAPSPEILAMKGMRLLWASEVNDSHRFAADKVKLLTGGDPLTGRGLNDKDLTTFLPTHTLFLLTNCKPGAPSSDDAFWERTYIIDFPYSFVASPDPAKPYQKKAVRGLAEELLEEAPGILARYVRGCLEYQRVGLSPPECVLEHTRQYRRSEDTIEDWIEECCETGPGDEFKTPFKQLYESFKIWWEGVSPYRPMTRKKFGEQLSMKYEKVKTGGTMHYFGIIIKPFGGNSSP